MKNILAPRTWVNPHQHFHAVIENHWYRFVHELINDFVFSTVDFFRNQGFSPALMPVTCSSVSSPMGLGSDSLPVEINLFNKNTYLADSMQFHLEYLMRQRVPGVFYIMPTFRGEMPDSRHLNQFFHSEAELVGTLEDVMTLVERYIFYCTDNILRNQSQKFKKLKINTDHIEQFITLGHKIPRITFQEARKVIGNNREFYSQLSEEIEIISHRGEQELMDKFGGIVWLTHFSKKSVPFYHAHNNEGYALCADLLMGIGEVVGCGQRHVTFEDTLNALREHKVNTSDYEWYLCMKKEYPLQTSGFGLGLERYLLWILRHDDIRDIPLFNRLKNTEGIP